MPRRLVIVGGPNGAGKTTFAMDYLQVYPYKYLSADALAAELSPGNPAGYEILDESLFSIFKRDLDEK